MKKKELYDRILEHFRAEMPEVTTELTYNTTFQLLVAVMLSAQCTDKRVNMVTPALFERFPDAARLADADFGEVLSLVSSVSYPNAKSQHLIDMARMLIEKYGGEVPHTLDELTSLPGVGRKTANVMLSVAFGENAMPVDTHVFRVSHRIGLVKKTDDTPLKVEKTLCRYIPSDELGRAHHWLLLHGRYICTARSPKCPKCPFNTICQYNL